MTRLEPSKGIGGIECGVCGRAMPGETESGDQYLIQPFPGGVLLAVVDGLGHGEEAASAAKRAVAVMEKHAQESITALLTRCHRELARTRGAVMSVASFDFKQHTMAWTGVGNVEGVLVRAAGSPEYIVQRGGVVGFNLPNLHTSTTTVNPGDTLILTTDGIDPHFSKILPLSESVQQLSDRLWSEYGKGNDDALVLVARYLGGQP